MSAASRRIVQAVAVLLLLLLGLVGLVSLPGAVESGPEAAAPAGLGQETWRFTPEQRATAEFLDNGRAAAGTGRGLFETDFFKPPPAPPPKPKPAAPTTRELRLVYRGLASFPDGTRVAYLAIEDRTVTLGVGEVVADGWKLSSFDGEQAVVAKEDKTLALPFNRRATLSVPVKP